MEKKKCTHVNLDPSLHSIRHIVAMILTKDLSDGQQSLPVFDTWYLEVAIFAIFATLIALKVAFI
jgi:hypothetical protein